MRSFERPLKFIVLHHMGWFPKVKTGKTPFFKNKAERILLPPLYVTKREEFRSSMAQYA